MSVTMHLYKVNPDVDYKGNYLTFAPAGMEKMGADGLYGFERYEKELGAPMREDGHWPKSDEDPELYKKYKEWEEEQESKQWSDNKEHHFFNWTEIGWCNRMHRGWRRMRNRMSNIKFKVFEHPRLGKQKYLCVDEVEYAQGWFFKKSFFNKEMTWVICTTKHQMECFFKQYIDYQNTDTRGAEAVKRFLNAWEDGMIFECAW